MTSQPKPSPHAARLERTYDAPAELIWELWTTIAGLGGWFAPDGFECPPTRLAYRSLIGFVPDHEPYEHLTTIDIEPSGDCTNVVVTVDPLHDETWTQQHRAHRGNELDNLEAAIRRRTMSRQPVAYVLSAAEGFEDEATVRRYAELAGPAIEHFGGRFIVSNAEQVVLEGVSPSGRLSMVEFPSIEDAKAWYYSPEYAEARAITPAAFRDRTLMIVEGVK